MTDTFWGDELEPQSYKRSSSSSYYYTVLVEYCWCSIRTQQKIKKDTPPHPIRWLRVDGPFHRCNYRVSCYRDMRRPAPISIPSPHAGQVQRVIFSSFVAGPSKKTQETSSQVLSTPSFACSSQILPGIPRNYQGNLRFFRNTCNSCWWIRWYSMWEKHQQEISYSFQTLVIHSN